MRLCHVGSAGCRRLFSRLFASAKGTYTPPRDIWQQQTMRDILLQHNLTEPAAATTTATAATANGEQETATETTVRCPAGAPLWQMPAMLLHKAGLHALQQPQHQGDAAAAAAAATAAAAAEGASGGAVSPAELQGWGNPGTFAGRWVEEVASLLFA